MSGTTEPPRRKTRLLSMFIAVFLIAAGIAAWLLRINDIINDLGAVSAIFGFLLALFQRSSASTQITSTSQDTLTVNNSSQVPPIEGISAESLGLTRGRGALIVYTNSHMLEVSFNLVFGFNRHTAKADFAEQVSRYRKNNRAISVCIFKNLPAGDYSLYSDPEFLDVKENVHIEAGQVKEIFCRRRLDKRTNVEGKA